MFQQIFVENRANSFLFSMASVVLKKITCCSFREGKRSQVAGVPVQRHLLAGVVVKHLSLVHRLHPGLRLRNPAPGLLPVFILWLFSASFYSSSFWASSSGLGSNIP